MKTLIQRFWRWFDGVFSVGLRDPELEDVRRFQQKFGHLINHEPTLLSRRKLYERLDCMKEELTEFEDAILEQDLAGQLDALIDLVYFAKGTAQMLGLGDIWVEAWLEVQRANMDKVPGIGKRSHKVDVIKPLGWRPPQHDAILERAGFDRTQFEVNGEVSSRLCSDDEVHRD